MSNDATEIDETSQPVPSDEEMPPPMPRATVAVEQQIDTVIDSGNEETMDDSTPSRFSDFLPRKPFSVSDLPQAKKVLIVSAARLAAQVIVEMKEPEERAGFVPKPAHANFGKIVLMIFKAIVGSVAFTDNCCAAVTYLDLEFTELRFVVVT